jgi:phenylacetate-CoA ligase
MSLFNLISENFILPSSDFLLNRSIAKNFKFLEKSQWWSENELINYQDEKLKLLIQHAYNNVPYYKNLFKSNKLLPNDIKTQKDLHKLPILTKDTIRTHFPHAIVAQNISKKQLIFQGSSGSTGEPLHYYSTSDSYSMNIAAGLRGWYWMGYRLGDKFVKLSQNPRNSIVKKIQDKINRNHYLFAQQLTEANFKRITESINEFKPAIIRGYPDPLFFLAKYMKDNNIKSSSPKAITTTGNIIFPEARDLIESQFGCKIFDAYSCEGGANVFECPTHGCYHSTMEYAISEILNNNGEEINPGERGRLYTTDLYNYAVPFIRYDSHDIVTKSDRKCTCNRHLLAIDQIEGRDNDILITPSGKYLIVHNFTGFFQQNEITSVQQFQIIQDKADHIVFKLVVTPNFTTSDEKKILQYWSNYIGNDVVIDLDCVAEIPITSSGKRRFIIRNPNIPLV